MTVERKEVGRETECYLQPILFLAAATLSLTAEKVEIDAQHFYVRTFPILVILDAV